MDKVLKVGVSKVVSKVGVSKVVVSMVVVSKVVVSMVVVSKVVAAKVVVPSPVFNRRAVRCQACQACHLGMAACLVLILLGPSTTKGSRRRQNHAHSTSLKHAVECIVRKVHTLALAVVVLCESKENVLKQSLNHLEVQ